MWRIFLLFHLLSSLLADAHPGVGIVKDSKGHIYYSDLHNVYKLVSGKWKVVVPGVHTHQLYVDGQDRLYGEHLYNDTQGKFFHYQWQLHTDGRLDTIVDPREAFILEDYSLARDAAGNEYYTRQFIREKDAAHIFKRTPDGKETIIASGNFKGVTWLHPQRNGNVYFALQNHIYLITPGVPPRIIASNIGNAQPSFSFSGNSITIWGIWEDDSSNVYVAVFSDQAVKQIRKDGSIHEYYRSKGQWSPNQGVFDGKGNLWLLESSDKNESRVVMISKKKSHVPTPEEPVRGKAFFWIIGISILLSMVLLFAIRKNR